MHEKEVEFVNRKLLTIVIFASVMTIVVLALIGFRLTLAQVTVGGSSPMAAHHVNENEYPNRNESMLAHMSSVHLADENNYTDCSELHNRANLAQHMGWMH